MDNLSDLNKKEREIRSDIADLMKQFRKSQISKKDLDKGVKSKNKELREISEKKGKLIGEDLPPLPSPPKPPGTGKPSRLDEIKKSILEGDGIEPPRPPVILQDKPPSPPKKPAAKPKPAASNKPPAPPKATPKPPAAKPAPAKPPTPVTTKPATPVTTKPATPVTTKPVSVATKPATPVTTKPASVATKPAASKPATSVTTKPATPVTTKPASVATKPATPVTTKPASVSTKPATVSTKPATSTVSTKPATPVNTKPAVATKPAAPAAKAIKPPEIKPPEPAAPKPPEIKPPAPVKMPGTVKQPVQAPSVPQISGDLSRKLEENATEIQNIKVDITRNEQELSQFLKEVRDTAQRIEKLEAVTSEIKDLKLKVKGIDFQGLTHEIYSQFERMNESIKESEKKTDDLVEKVNVEIKTLKERIEEATQAKEHVENLDVSTLRTDMEALKQKSEYIEHHLENVDVRPIIDLIRDVENKVNSLRVSSPLIIE